MFYDVLMDDGGMSLVLRPLLNYTEFSLDAVRIDARAPRRAGVGDGGALRHDVRAREHADVHADN